MSYNNKSNSSKSSNGKKPFCKVCQDAGKPESEYTSHFVRTLPDINGKSIVTCPVLNSTECRYCCQLGHTSKFCPVIEKNEKRNKKDNYAAAQYQKSEQRISAISAPTVENKYRGAFAALDCENDETQAKNKKDIPVIEKNDYFPALVSKQTIVAPSAGVWATIAAKPAVPHPPQVKPEVKQEVKPAGKPELKPYFKPELKPYFKQEVKQEVSEFLKQQVKKASAAKSWADESDTEDDDDYDIVEAPPPSLVSTADENDDYDW
jgi:hypothetical protein